MTRIGGFVPKGPARFLQGSGFGYPGSWAVLIREPQIRILEPLGSDVVGFSPSFLPQQEIELEPSRSPMEIILGRLWARMSAPEILAMRRNLDKFITAIEGNLKVGTACSGSDVVLPTVNNALALWRQEFGFQVSFEHAYSCESVEFKQRWILKHFGKNVTLYPDLERLSDGVTENIHGQMERIKRPHFFICGIECDSVSALNIRRAENHVLGCRLPDPAFRLSDRWLPMVERCKVTEHVAQHRVR